MKTYLAVWNSIPTLRAIAEAWQNYPQPLYLVCIIPTGTHTQPLPHTPSNDQENHVFHALNNTLATFYNGAPNITYLADNVQLWLMPSEIIPEWHDYFPSHSQLIFSDGLIPPATPQTSTKHNSSLPWFATPPTHTVQHAAVIGGGISGATQARALAERGIKVSLFEAQQPAHAASGNRQGLLYAKISPHETDQTALLLSGYGFSRRLLQRLLPNNEGWGGSGVLHLNHNPAEAKRNQQLSQHHHRQHLYQAWNANQSTQQHTINTIIADISDGLLWPQGVWISPPVWIDALLNHHHIQVYTQTPVHHLQYHHHEWQLDTAQGTHHFDCVFFCTGADTLHAPLPDIARLPLRIVRGQTSLAKATPQSSTLSIALSGTSYFTPEWQGWHCYGATFQPNDADNSWRAEDEVSNQNALNALIPKVANTLLASNAPKGHAALRCDSPDHLPVAGPISPIDTLYEQYAKLAQDKHFPITTACPFLPGIYINTAHGSRGLATAPLLAESLTAMALNLPNPLPIKLRHAVHPNRLIIRSIIRHQYF